MMDSMGDRMKRYEAVTRSVLVRRMPVVLRLDGKAFHSFTKKVGAGRPFCETLHGVMMATTAELVRSVQGCQVGYTQSDEITLLLTDYEQLNTDAWFDYEVQKMVSISAATATAAFNAAGFAAGYKHTALFDSRAFNVPVDDVVNNFLWRQKDASKNSISMYAQSMFSHAELHGKNGDQKQEMMFAKTGFNWNDATTWTKRGACVYRETREVDTKNGKAPRSVLVHDNEIPLFNLDRDFIGRWLRTAGQADGH